MKKWQVILLMLLPTLSAASRYLKTRDADTVGLDDIIAGQIDALIASLSNYDGEADSGS